MTLVLDAGAFLALERGDRAMWRRLKAAVLSGQIPVTHGGVIAQVWRGGSGRQAQFARALQSIAIADLDEALGKAAGLLLANCGLSDGIDAAVVAMTVNGDRIVTSDPVDIATLLSVSGLRVDVIAV